MFFDPGKSRFDFSYYMQQHPEFEDVDIVNIFLGRNDGYVSDALLRIGYMIDSIHEYNPDIIVTVMSAYNVECDNSDIGRGLANSHMYNIDAHNFNVEFNGKFDGKENIIIIPQHFNLDSKYDYTTWNEKVSERNSESFISYSGGVHPKESGYQHFGDVYFAYVIAIEIDNPADDMPKNVEE